MFGEGGGVYQKFKSKNLCLLVPTKIAVGESFNVAFFSGIERFGGEGGEVSRFSVNNFLSHSPDEKFRRRILYCCINFGYRKSLEQRGGGWEYQVFPSKIFCLTVPKISVGESFSVALIFGEERGGGGYQKFTSKCFCLTVPKMSVGRVCFIVALISGTEKVWRRGGVSKISVKNFLSHGAEKFRRGMLYCCINFWNRKCLEKGGGCIKNFRQKFFVSQCRRKIP